MRLSISNVELLTLASRDFAVCKLGDFYLTRIIRAANDLGLKGQKIKEIVQVDESFLPHGNNYIDFICEEKK